MITQLLKSFDLNDCRDNGYPVFTDIWTCDVEADAVIDFCTAKATDTLLEYCEKRQIPVVLCTTGLTDEQIKKVEETSKHYSAEIRKHVSWYQSADETWNQLRPWQQPDLTWRSWKNTIA